MSSLRNSWRRDLRRREQSDGGREAAMVINVSFWC